MKKAKKAPKGKPKAKAINDEQLKNVSGGLMIKDGRTTLATSTSTYKFFDKV